jgi:hypothetical protein
MSQSKQQDYAVEREGGLEYVVVRCPQGHRMRGMKVGDMKVRQEVSCTECKWTRPVSVKGLRFASMNAQRTRALD